MTQHATEYHYSGYTIWISPNLTGYHWAIQNDERIAYASESCRTPEDAERMAEGVVDHLNDASNMHVPDFQKMNRK